MGYKYKINHKKLKKAIPGSKGQITRIAKALGVERRTVYSYLEEFPECRDWIEKEKEKLVDIAEDVLYEMLLDYTEDGEGARNRRFAVNKVLSSYNFSKVRGWDKDREDESKGDDKSFVVRFVEKLEEEKDKKEKEEGEVKAQ